VKTFRDLTSSEEEMNNLCRRTKTSNTPHNFSWLIPDKLARCAVPSDSRDIDGLVDLGVTKLITLLEEKLPAQMNLRDSVSGLKHEIHGCVEFEGIPVDKIVKIIDSIENEIGAGGKVAVHCRAGNGRTGTVLAAFIMKENNLSSMEAIAFVRKLRRWSVETKGQENCLVLYGQYLLNGILQDIETTDDDTFSVRSFNFSDDSDE